MSSGTAVIRISPGAEELVSSLGLRCIQDGWREDLPGKMINDRGDRQVLRLQVPGTGEAVYLKRWRFPESSPYRYLPGRRSLRRRASTEFENLHKLAEIGIRAPSPLLLVEERGPWGPVATLLLLEGLVDYVPASDWVREHTGDAELLCGAIARLIALLHRHRLYYRSPGLKHFYIRKPRPASDPSHARDTDEGIALIDVPRLDRGSHPFLNRLWQKLGTDPPCPERDLSKVLLTLTQELRASPGQVEVFWSTYCAEAGVGADADRLRRSVTQLAEVRSGRRKRHAGAKAGKAGH